MLIITPWKNLLPTLHVTFSEKVHALTVTLFAPQLLSVKIWKAFIFLLRIVSGQCCVYYYTLSQHHILSRAQKGIKTPSMDLVIYQNQIHITPYLSHSNFHSLLRALKFRKSLTRLNVFEFTSTINYINNFDKKAPAEFAKDFLVPAIVNKLDT